MATVEQLRTALRNADKAGDTAAAQQLARSIRQMEAASTQQAPQSRAAEVFSKFSSKATTQPAVSQYENAPGWVKPIIAASDIVTLAGRAPMMGFGEKLVAGGRSLVTGNSYEDELAQQRAQTTGARKRSGLAGTTAEIATNVKALPQLVAGKAAGLGTRAVVGAAEGAGYGAASAAGEDQNIGEGAMWGGLFGAGGSMVADLVKAGGDKVAAAFKAYGAEPTQKAKAAIWKAAQDAGITPDKIRATLRQLGPEGMTADVLGKRGTTLGRAASNLSPDARETLETAVQGRKAGQNERVVQTIEEASGITPGSRKTVDQLKAEAYDKVRPEIDAAYEKARAEGVDLDKTAFADLLSSPMGSKTYKEAEGSLRNRAAAEGKAPDAPISELARLDQVQRQLGDIGSSARRAGNNDLASQAFQLQERLKGAMDASIAGPQYQQARSLRKGAGDVERAIDTGKQLAGGRIPADLPAKARGLVEGPDKAASLLGMRQGYGLQQSENLLNRGQTEGAINVLNRPLQREAAEAALGPEGAAALAQRLDAEKTMNATARDIVGNSTTARQLLEASGMAAAGTGLEWLTGIPNLSTLGTVGGMARAAGTLIPMARRALASRGQTETANEIANLLVQPNSIPTSNPIPSPQMAEETRQMMARLLARAGIISREPASQ